MLIGIGIGLILATIVLNGTNYNKQMTQTQIEEKARSYGMDYPSNFTVISNKGAGK